MSVLLEGPPERSQLPPQVLAKFREEAELLLARVGHPEAELSISLVSDADIQELNAQHRGKPSPTDVLSYSLVEGEHADYRGKLLGDVVISIETAGRQAAAREVSVAEELLRLLIHGVLHLLGHDHEEEEEARRMHALEERLWHEIAR